VVIAGKFKEYCFYLSTLITLEGEGGNQSYCRFWIIYPDRIKTEQK